MPTHKKIKFMKAVYQEDLRTVEYWLQTGHPCVSLDRYEVARIFYMVTDVQHFEIIRMALLWGDSDCKPIAIRHYVQRKNVPVVKKILELGADPNTYYEDYGLSLLHKAVGENDVEMVKLLLSYNAHIDVWDRCSLGRYICTYDTCLCNDFSEEEIEGNYLHKRTPLFKAIKCKNVAMCKLLVTRGADVNAVNDWGLTPMHAVAFTHTEGVKIAKLLMANGGCLDTQDTNGLTPLFHSIQVENLQLSRLFIQSGCDVNDEVTHIAAGKILYRPSSTVKYKILQLLIKAGMKKSENNGIGLFMETLHLRRESNACLTDFVPYVSTYLENVPPLMFMCKIKIRNKLVETGNGRSIYNRVKTLPLLQQTKQYLMLEENDVI